MKKTILLVDDEIDIQNRYFLQAGYDVLVAHDLWIKFGGI